MLMLVLTMEEVVAGVIDGKIVTDPGCRLPDEAIR